MNGGWNKRRCWPNEQRHTKHLPRSYGLMGSLLLHHCCWYNWLPCQHKLNPFLCVCVCASVSVLLFYLSVNGEGGQYTKQTCSCTQTSFQAQGVGGHWTTTPLPLHHFSLWLISGETWRHPLCPSSCPLHYEGTLASQCTRSPPRLALLTWHHCTHVPLQLHKGCAGAWRCNESVCACVGFCDRNV